MLSTSSPSRASAQSRLRAKSVTAPALPASASASGCLMLAEAKTWKASPASILLRIRPEGPKVAATSAPLCRL